MTDKVDLTLRGPAAYDLAKSALRSMEQAGVWPTPLNFELWLHYAAEPEGALGREIRRLLKVNPTITEAVAGQGSVALRWQF